MSRMMEMAKDLGRSLAQTDEYQILKVAVSSTEDDGDMAGLRTELKGLERKIEEALEAGSEPDDELKSSYEDAVRRLQSSSTYQRLVSAQANFDKVLLKVNHTIQEGIADGAESRIIMP
jgi:cell fate (sporulation/competence/biofilm development) regulator YlbF (YheA/YmcA/DUF963 family)